MTFVIAHRGYCVKSPENTLLSIKHAFELGCDGVEFDVRATKDRKLVLFHDKTLSRMAGSRKTIASLDYDELSKVNIQGARIPLLSQVLSYLSQTSILIIVPEIKVEGFEKEIFSLLKKYNLVNRTVISSHQPSVLRKFRLLSKTIRLAYVMDNRPDRIKTWRSLNKEVGLFSVHHFHNRPISNSRFISKVKSHGVMAIPWFLINSEQEKRMKKLLAFGVDGIITDRPDMLIELLNNQS